MIDLIGPMKWASSESLRREVFEFRHRIFVRHLDWDITHYDRLEFDEFDALLPFYMIYRSYENNIRAVWRLLPTTGPYMLRNIFPHFLGSKKAPQSKNVWEISRFAFDPGGFGVDGILDFSRISGELFCALGEFGIENGIEEVVAVFDTRFFLILRNLGTPPIWMGRPQKIGALTAVAASFEVSRSRLEQIRKITSLAEPVISCKSLERKAA